MPRMDQKIQNRDAVNPFPSRNSRLALPRAVDSFIVANFTLLSGIFSTRSCYEV